MSASTKASLINDIDTRKARGIVQRAVSKVQKRFETKAEATAGGSLEKALGRAGGSVKIQKENGRYQEERTFPRSNDPRKSPG